MFTEDDGTGKKDRAVFQNWFLDVCGTNFICSFDAICQHNSSTGSLHSMAKNTSTVSNIMKDPYTYFTKESRPVDANKEPVRLLPGNLFSLEEFTLWRARLCRAADGRAPPFVFLAPGGQPVLLCPPKPHGEQVSGDDNTIPVKCITITKSKANGSTEAKKRRPRQKKAVVLPASDTEETSTGLEVVDSIEMNGPNAEGDSSSDEVDVRFPFKAKRKRARQIITSDTGSDNGSTEQNMGRSSRRKSQKVFVLVSKHSKLQSKPAKEPPESRGGKPAPHQSPSSSGISASKRKKEDNAAQSSKRPNLGLACINPNRLCMSPEDLVRKVDPRFNVIEASSTFVNVWLEELT